jgi:hypothetical protein
MKRLIVVIFLACFLGCQTQADKAVIYQAATVEFQHCFEESEKCRKLLSQFEHDKMLDNREVSMKELRELITDYEARMEKLGPILQANRPSGY